MDADVLDKILARYTLSSKAKPEPTVLLDEFTEAQIARVEELIRIKIAQVMTETESAFYADKAEPSPVFRAIAAMEAKPWRLCD